MRQGHDSRGNLTEYVPDIQLGISHQGEVKAFCAVEMDTPSSCLSSEEWRAIADSLGLSSRQLQVSQCVLDGLDEQGIGKHLGISHHTVHAHLNRLYRKTCVTNRCDLVARLFVAYLDRSERI